MIKPSMNHIQSAIIGYWKSGASVSMIVVLTGLSKGEVENIVNEYSINKLKNDNFNS